MPKNQYATLSQPGTKKVSVCSRRIGSLSRDRLTVIAVCTSGDVAEKIVDALNHLQGTIVKIETLATQELAALRDTLCKERARADDFRCQLATAEQKLRLISRELATATSRLNKAEHNSGSVPGPDPRNLVP